MGTDHQKLVGYNVDHNGVCHNGWSYDMHTADADGQRESMSLQHTAKDNKKQHKHSTFGQSQHPSQMKSRLNTGL